MKFKNKQTGIEIDAIQYFDTVRSINHPDNKFLDDVPFTVVQLGKEEVLHLYGGIQVWETYWIVKSSEGFFFPVHDELFQKLYESVE